MKFTIFMCLIAVCISLQAEGPNPGSGQCDTVIEDPEGENLNFQLQAVMDSQCLEELAKASSSLSTIFQESASKTGSSFLKRMGGFGVFNHQKRVIEWNHYMNYEAYTNVDKTIDLNVDVLFSKKSVIKGIISDDLKTRLDEENCVKVELESYDSLNIYCLINNENNEHDHGKEPELYSPGERQPRIYHRHPREGGDDELELKNWEVISGLFLNKGFGYFLTGMVYLW